MPPRTNGAIRSTTLMPVSKISIAGERSPKAGGSRWIGQRSPFAGLLAVDGVADHVPDAAERLFADGHGDRPLACPRPRLRGRARRSSPWPRPGRDRRRGAAAPPRSARASRRPRATWMLSAWLISGSRSGKTASSTTPLISTIFPVFLPLLLSATESPLMRRGRRRSRAAAGSAHSSRARVRAPRSNRPRLRSLPPWPRQTSPRLRSAAGRRGRATSRRRSAPSCKRRRAARPSSSRAVVAALVWANVDPASYERVWTTTLSITFGAHWHLRGPPRLDQQRPDGLLLLRDRARGPARVRPRRAARAAAGPLPLLAGLGGMVVPVAIYLAINAGHSSVAWLGNGDVDRHRIRARPDRARRHRACRTACVRSSSRSRSSMTSSRCS